MIMRKDFDDLAGYDQVGRVLRRLVKEQVLIKIGYGLYAKTKISSVSGKTIPVKPLPVLAREARGLLGIETPSEQERRDYNNNLSTQIPTGRMIRVKGRISRKIGYSGTYVKFVKT